MNNVRVVNQVGELMPMTNRDMQEIVVADAVQTIGELAEHTTHVFVSWDGAPIRLRMDGGDPVGGASGHLLPDGGADVWSRRFALKAKVIRDGAVSATLRVTEMGLC